MGVFSIVGQAEQAASFAFMERRLSINTQPGLEYRLSINAGI